MVVASLVRCERLFPIISKRKFKKQHLAIAGEFVTWVAALMRQDGTQVFSKVDSKITKFDIGSIPKQSAKQKSTKITKTKAGNSKKGIAKRFD